MSPVAFETTLGVIDDTVLVLVPSEASARLPTRGQVAVRAVVAGCEFATVVEPDGRRGHWVRLPDGPLRETGLGPGDTARVELRVLPQWPEPEVPEDLSAAVTGAPVAVQEAWRDITAMARWEWVRWVQATRNPQTRERRVEVSVSKLADGKRRPCCFDLSSCTDPELARSGKLRDPA